jgi:hypothetical protein
MRACASVNGGGGFIVTCKGNHCPGACSTSIAPKSESVYLLDAESDQVGTVGSFTYGSRERPATYTYTYGEAKAYQGAATGDHNST